MSVQTAVTYSYGFTTATAATLTAVTMTVPAGAAGVVAAGTVYGIGAGTVSLTGTTLTYTVTAPAAVAVNFPIYISFTGLTNTATADCYTSTITTQKAGPITDSATSAAVTFGSSSTGVTVTVGQTLTFTNNTPSFSLAVDPTSLNNVQSQAVVLTVQTNAANGYTLAMSDTGLSIPSPAFTIPAVSIGPTVGVVSFPSVGWGASATLSGGGTDGAALASGLTGGKFVGYPSASTPGGYSVERRAVRLHFRRSDVSFFGERSQLSGDTPRPSKLTNGHPLVEACRHNRQSRFVSGEGESVETFV